MGGHDASSESVQEIGDIIDEGTLARFASEADRADLGMEGAMREGTMRDLILMEVVHHENRI